jgi:hypothetical protein
LYILIGRSDHPKEYYSGGTHVSDGEKIPNTVCSVQFAKKYDSEVVAKRQADKLNSKYSWYEVFDVYGIGDMIASSHGVAKVE